MFIMHIGFFACFHAISLERSSFSKITTLLFHALVALKMLVSLISRLVACSPRIVVDKQTDRQTDKHRRSTVTLPAHARPGLIIIIIHDKKPGLAVFFLVCMRVREESEPYCLPSNESTVIKSQRFMIILTRLCEKTFQTSDVIIYYH